MQCPPTARLMLTLPPRAQRHLVVCEGAVATSPESNCSAAIAEGLAAQGFTSAAGVLTYGHAAESGGTDEVKGELKCYEKDPPAGAIDLPAVERGHCVVVIGVRKPGAGGADGTVSLAGGTLIEKGPPIQVGVELWKDKDYVALQPLPAALNGADEYRLCWSLSGEDCKKSGMPADQQGAAGVPAVTTPGTATNSTDAGGEADVGDARGDAAKAVRLVL